MAVEVKFTICEESNCESINFRELTGAYNASTNTTGWGAPNEVVGDAVSATLVLKSPSGVTYSSIDMLALSYPTVDSFAQTEILASTVDSSLTTFADGFWTITYSVTTGTTTYTQTKTFFLYCGIKKEVCALVAAMRLCDCDCDPDSINRTLQAQSYLYALEYAVGLGDTTSALELFDTLENLINCTIC